MKKIKLPSPITIFFGSLGSFWLANIINPGFNPIGVMILLFIPILIFELLYPQPELQQLLEQSNPVANEEPVQEAPPKVAGELIDDGVEAA